MRRSLLVCTVMAASAVFGTAHAQMAVIDVGAISRLVAQLRTAEQQLSTTREALREAQNTYASMTGSRGVERLLSNTHRNYLPPNWTELSAALANAHGTYTALSRDLQQLVDGNAELSAEQLNLFAPTDRQVHEGQRRNVALLQALSRQALGEASRRFASLQQLIDAIGTTRDPKAIAELNARISAEQLMLQNDASKLASLYQSAQAEQLATQMRLQERAIAEIGSLRDLPPMGLE